MRELAVGLAEQGNRVLDLGPAQLRRVRRLLRRAARSRPCRPTPWWPARASRHDAGRDHRRLRWRPGVAARRRTPPRGRGRRRRLVDQRRASTACCRWPPTTAADSVGEAWRDGMEAVAGLDGVGRGASSATRRTASASWTRTGPSSSPPWSAGCWPTAPATASTCPGLPDAEARGRWTCPRWSSAAGRATRTTPGPPRRRWPSCCPGPPGRAAVG